MSPDDALYRYRVRVFALAEEMGSVRAACRALGIHPSTFYRWRKLVRRGGLEMLRPRERRIPQMPNHTPVFIEQRVLAYALGHAGEGPKRISAELAREKWGANQAQPQRRLSGAQAPRARDRGQASRAHRRDRGTTRA